MRTMHTTLAATGRRPIVSFPFRNHPAVRCAVFLCTALVLMSAFNGAAATTDDGRVPSDLLRDHPDALLDDTANVPAAVASSTNECGGKCSCLGEYMDCAHLHLVQFAEHLPEWIATLDLSQNDLGDNIDQLVGNASGLTELKLRNNALHKFPVFRGLASLKTLQLAYNQIEVISAEALLALPGLVSLDLSKNLIKLVLPNAFPSSNRLRNLNLNFNRIEALDELSLMHLRHLAELRLSQNRLRAIPVGLFRGLKKLRRMELNDNQIANLTYKTFANLTNLRALRIRGNRLRELPTGVFHGLSNLAILELDNNQLTDIQKNGLFNLSTLITLSLSNNSIANIAPGAWEFSQHLETIELSNNRLSTITPQTFEYLEHLTTLSMRNNAINIIGDAAFNCTANLEQLDLSSNRISYIVEDANGPFRALRKLSRLALADNRIKSVNHNAFVGLIALEHLDLAANNITSIQTDAFARLSSLRTLHMNTSSLLCDCNLLQFHAWLRSAARVGLTDVRASCGYPSSMRGRPLQSLQTGAFTCNDTPKPRIIEEPPAQLLAIRERNATLTCSATASAAAATSTMTLKWKRDQVELGAAAQVEREFSVQPLTNVTLATARLRLINVDDSHAGRYQCVVSNAYGTAYSQKVRVTVASFPKFRKIPGNLTINATSTARLDCAATGEPKPQISWEKDGGNDFPAARERRMHVMTEDDAFFIVNAKSSDQGVYTCTAENSAGTIKADGRLTVHEPPSFAKPMENREVPVGKSSVIECRAVGSPKPSLVWHRGNRTQQPIGVTERHFFAADGQLLIIVDTEPSDAGSYSCTIANSLGSQTGSMQLKVQTAAAAAAAAAAASAPKGLKAEEITGLVIITIVCCAVGTSVIWVVIIYQTRHRRGCCMGGGVPRAGSQSPTGVGGLSMASAPDSLLANGTLPSRHAAAMLLNGGRYESQTLLSGRRTPQIVGTPLKHSIASGEPSTLLGQSCYDDVSLKDSGHGGDDSTRRSLHHHPVAAAHHHHKTYEPCHHQHHQLHDLSGGGNIELDDRTSSSRSLRLSPTMTSDAATSTPSTEEALSAGCGSPTSSLGRVHIQANRLSELLAHQQRPLPFDDGNEPSTTTTTPPPHTSSSSTRANSSLSDSIPQVPSAQAAEQQTTSPIH